MLDPLSLFCFCFLVNNWWNFQIQFTHSFKVFLPNVLFDPHPYNIRKPFRWVKREHWEEVGKTFFTNVNLTKEVSQLKNFLSFVFDVQRNIRSKEIEFRKNYIYTFFFYIIYFIYLPPKVWLNFVKHCSENFCHWFIHHRLYFGCCRKKIFTPKNFPNHRTTYFP